MKIEGKLCASVSYPYPSISSRVIVYYRRKYRKSDGKAPIMLEVNMNNMRVRFNTSVMVTPDGWDEKNFCVKKNYPDSKNLNLIIQNCKARINDIFVRYKLQFKELTPDILKNEYLRPSVNVDFLMFMEEAIAERRGVITNSSMAQHRAHLNKLKEFRPALTFSELSADFFIDYHRWLKNSKDNGQNTRWNSIKTIRTYINIAKRRKLIEENPLDHMPVRQCKSDFGFLNEDELKILVDLYRKNTLPETHQRVLRCYLFCCFTSIRISDLKLILMENIIGNILVLMPYKTQNVDANTVKIPLNKVARQLIHDEAPYRVKGRVFKLLSEPRIRLYLNEVLEFAKLRKLKFHSSRHTFATVFLKKTKNLAALQKILGHSHIERTMMYAHCLTSDIEKEMKMMDKF